MRDEKFFKILSEETQARVAKDIKDKNKDTNATFDPEMMRAGDHWFSYGFKLENAPDNLKNNKSFIDGYNRACRRKAINDQLYELGKICFTEGKSLSDVDQRFANNEAFVQGYNAALKAKKRK